MKSNRVSTCAHRLADLSQRKQRAILHETYGETEHRRYDIVPYRAYYSWDSHEQERHIYFGPCTDFEGSAVGLHFEDGRSDSYLRSIVKEKNRCTESGCLTSKFAVARLPKPTYRHIVDDAAVTMSNGQGDRGVSLVEGSSRNRAVGATSLRKASQDGGRPDRGVCLSSTGYP